MFNWLKKWWRSWEREWRTIDIPPGGGQLYLNIGDQMRAGGLEWTLTDIGGGLVNWISREQLLAMQSSEERGDKRYLLLAYVGEDVRKVEHLGSSTFVKIFTFRGNASFAIMKDGDDYVVTNLLAAWASPTDNIVVMDPENTWTFPTWDAAVAAARLETRR